MVKHNNSIPKGHFKKNWQKFIKTSFNQPSKREKRRKIRTVKKKMIEQKKLSANVFLPIVHCPTLMHNTRVKFGRGFSKKEIEMVGLKKKIAFSFGISIDIRRRNKNLENNFNFKRLESLIKNLEVLKKIKKRVKKKKESVEVTKPVEENRMIVKKKCYKKRKYNIKRSFWESLVKNNHFKI